MPVVKGNVNFETNGFDKKLNLLICTGIKIREIKTNRLDFSFTSSDTSNGHSQLL